MARKFICTSSEPIVKTAQGKLRGYRIDSTYVFLGVPYAKAKRFMMPEPPDSWDGIKNVLNYSFTAPLMDHSISGEPIPRRFWPEGEDCLNLNIWTQTVDKNAKKPVMVWYHGGGFSIGSAIKHQSYDGENLSKNGDVVVVTVNHRLNILGFFDLSDFGEKYKNSGNAGIADLVASLRWIRENIAAFGGDPDNVTIFGQSGGGGKVTTLLQTPEADGLFAKAINMSGVLGSGTGPSTEIGSGYKIAHAMLKAAGLTDADVDKLEELPYYELCELYNKVVPDLIKQGVKVGWAPLANGYYVGDPLEVGFTEHAKTVPLLIGTVFGEMAHIVIENKDKLTEAQQEALVRQEFGDNADKLLALYKKAYPGKNLADLLYLDTNFRKPALEYMMLRAQSGAEVFAYMFALELPFEDGKPTWHAAEIPFMFYNAGIVPLCNIPGVSDRIEAQTSGAFVNFAKCGNPSNPAIGEWPAFKPDTRATMIIDEKSEVRYDFDRELIELLYKVAPPKPRKPGPFLN